VPRDQIPLTDRWRIGFPDWSRRVRGKLFDPYNQNPLKGDYPIIGQHTFMDITMSQLTFMEYRRIPTQGASPECTPCAAVRLFGWREEIPETP